MLGHGGIRAVGWASLGQQLRGRALWRTDTLDFVRERDRACERVLRCRVAEPGRRPEIGQADVSVVQGDLTQFPTAVVSDLSDAVGKTLSASVGMGQALRADSLRVTPAILQGQTVKVVSQGPGFRVSAEGKAIANAAAGQLAHVRTASGQTVSGIARADGTVEINF